MATQEARLRALAQAIGAKIKTLAAPQLPAGGSNEQVLRRLPDGSGGWDFTGQNPMWLDVAGSNQQLVAGFQRCLFSAVARDDAGRWDSNNKWYSCPYTGWYAISAQIRAAEGTPAGTQIGVGVSASEGDTKDFIWFGGSGAMRTGFCYARLAYQNAGDALRMFGYSDQGAVLSQYSMQIACLRRAA